VQHRFIREVLLEGNRAMTNGAQKAEKMATVAECEGAAEAGLVVIGQLEV
jgi:hypothetical protein